MKTQSRSLTRSEIGDLLAPRPGQQMDELVGLTLEGMEATLRGIEAGSIHRNGYSLHTIAAAMGYLLAGCPAHAASAARQAVIPYALPGVLPCETPAQLLAGIAKLRVILKR